MIAVNFVLAAKSSLINLLVHSMSFEHLWIFFVAVGVGEKVQGYFNEMLAKTNGVRETLDKYFNY